MNLQRIYVGAKSRVLQRILSRTKPHILTDYYGIRFVLYPSDSAPLQKILSRINYRSEFAAIERLVPNKGIVIDAGANIGLHSVFMSRLAGKQGRVYAFEPVQNTFEKLKKTIALNNARNVTPVLSALKEHLGREEMNIYPEDYHSWNTFGEPVEDESRPIGKQEVEVDTLDHFTKEQNIQIIDFLKIDVEGTEKDVFKGATELLKNKQISALSFEISQTRLAGTNTQAKELFEVLASYGYHAYDYNMQLRKFNGPIQDSSEVHQNYFASYKDLTRI